jgi:hypothetical protein
MDDARRSELIEAYGSGVAEVTAALDAVLSADRLDSVPPDGGWTPRMVVHHLADSETRAAIRLRQLLAEDEPTIHGYDEELYARVLHYERPVERSLDLLRAVREANLELLHLLGEGAFRREGTHTETGAYSVGTWLGTYAAHAHDHATQMRAVL